MSFRIALAVLLGLGCSTSSVETPAADRTGAEARDGGSAQAPARDAGANDAAADAADAADAAPQRTTIRVHYAGNAGALALRGSAAPLSWETSAALTPIGNDTYEWSTDAMVDLEFKPLLDGAWSLGPNYQIRAGAQIDLQPRFRETRGQVSIRWPSFTSSAAPSTRAIWVYLPPTYVENSASRMGALYMHDGQNLFSAASAFGGNEWMVDETLDQGAADGSIRETIVIGIESTARRVYELTPSVDPDEASGGEADAYLSMLESELKPRVDAELRTLPGREHTALFGASLGGLVSVYAGVHRANVFGLIGAMSPSTWWDGTMILGEVAAMPNVRPLRFYVDSGNAGPSNDDVLNTAELAAGLRAVGYQDGTTLQYVVQDQAQHSETYWAQRLPAALRFLLGPR